MARSIRKSGEEVTVTIFHAGLDAPLPRQYTTWGLKPSEGELLVPK